MDNEKAIRPAHPIEKAILVIRGERIILDDVLAALYGVTTKRLNEQVRRNSGRFPPDFMFSLTPEEEAGLRSQIATSKTGRGGRRYPSYVFTEHGAIMAASVLNTPRAVEMSIFVVRAFIRLRGMLTRNKALAATLADLEKRLSAHDKQILAIIQTLRRLMTLPEKPKTPIGYKVKAKAVHYRIKRKAGA